MTLDPSSQLHTSRQTLQRHDAGSRPGQASDSAVPAAKSAFRPQSHFCSYCVSCQLTFKLPSCCHLMLTTAALRLMACCVAPKSLGCPSTQVAPLLQCSVFLSRSVVTDAAQQSTVALPLVLCDYHGAASGLVHVQSRAALAAVSCHGAVQKGTRLQLTLSEHLLRHLRSSCNLPLDIPVLPCLSGHVASSADRGNACCHCR